MVSFPDSTAYSVDEHTTYFHSTYDAEPGEPDRSDFTCSVYVFADGRLSMYVQPCKPSHSADEQSRCSGPSGETAPTLPLPTPPSPGSTRAAPRHGDGAWNAPSAASPNSDTWKVMFRSAAATAALVLDASTPRRNTGVREPLTASGCTVMTTSGALATTCHCSVAGCSHRTPAMLTLDSLMPQVPTARPDSVSEDDAALVGAGLAIVGLPVDRFVATLLNVRSYTKDSWPSVVSPGSRCEGWVSGFNKCKGERKPSIK